MHPGYYDLADNLVGHTVGKWFINSKILHKPSSGGTFSVGYEATDAQGNKGFLKALDYSSAFGHPGQADMLNQMTSAYIFERDLLAQCSNRRLKYVVKIIDHGQYTAAPGTLPVGVSFCLPVDYLVLEMADNSVRSLIDLSKSFDYAYLSFLYLYLIVRSFPDTGYPYPGFPYLDAPAPAVPTVAVACGVFRR